MADSVIASFYAILGLKPQKKEWAAGDRLVGSLKRALLGLGAVIGVTSLKGLVDSTIETASAAVDMAQKMGVTIERVQELSHAAKLSSTDIGSLRLGFQKLGSSLKLASKGQGEAGAALKKLGISIKDPAIQAAIKGDVDAGFTRIAEAFNQLGPEVNKTQIAVELFGRSGHSLIPLLSEGKEGIAKLSQEARDFGVVIGGDTAKQMKKFADDQLRLKARLTGLTNSVVSALLPTFEKLLARLSVWIDKNRELIAQGLENVINALVFAFETLATVVGFVVEVFKAVGQNAELTRAILLALATVLGIVGARAAWAWIQLAGPWILLVAAITGVILVLQDLLDAIMGAPSVIGDVWEVVVDAFKQAGQDLLNVGRKIGRFFANVAKGFRDEFFRAVNGVKSVFNRIGAFFEGVADGIRAVFQTVWDWIADKVDWALGVVNRVWEEIKNLNPFGAGRNPGGIVGAAVAAQQRLKEASTIPAVTTATTPANVSANANITINAPNADAKEVETLLKGTFMDWMDGTLRHTADATE